MNLLAWIIVGASLYVGWKAHEKKDQLKSWLQSKLRFLNNKTKNL